jgi:hypothetical protein
VNPLERIDELEAQVVQLEAERERLHEAWLAEIRARGEVIGQRERQRPVIEEIETWRWVLDPADAQRALASILAAVDALDGAGTDERASPPA